MRGCLGLHVGLLRLVVLRQHGNGVFKINRGGRFLYDAGEGSFFFSRYPEGSDGGLDDGDHISHPDPVTFGFFPGGDRRIVKIGARFGDANTDHTEIQR